MLKNKLILLFQLHVLMLWICIRRGCESCKRKRPWSNHYINCEAYQKLVATRRRQNTLSDEEGTIEDYKIQSIYYINNYN